jgi:hypothetical protein
MHGGGCGPRRWSQSMLISSSGMMPMDRIQPSSAVLIAYSGSFPEYARWARSG